MESALIPSIYFSIPLCKTHTSSLKLPQVSASLAYFSPKCISPFLTIPEIFSDGKESQNSVLLASNFQGLLLLGHNTALKGKSMLDTVSEEQLCPLQPPPCLAEPSKVLNNK